jgi:beta-alanine--pyruvate transaminase
VQKQAATLDYATAFQLGHPTIFEMADKLVNMAPDGVTHVFFSNSGSEAVDTALKIALAYHRARGEGHRTRLIGREKGYHGVGFGGISVGGMSPNRKMFGALLPAVDHLKHTHNLEHNAFSVGQPEWGGHLADELSDILALHDPSTVAAVILEPIAGSAGVLIPPVGYLDRIRKICDEHGILLIMDEVIPDLAEQVKALQQKPLMCLQIS